jgi:3-oxoacyl-[acyl-carrier-protein] synthase II
MIPIANQRVVITGVGCWTGLGEFNRSWERLLAKQTSIQLQQPFSELPPLPLSLIGEKPIFLSELTGKVVRAALADAKLTPPLPSCGVVVGSSRGGQGEIEKWARKETRTQPWLNILPQQSAIAAAQIVGSTDRVLSPMAACSTGLWSIAQGYDLIKEGRCQQVIAGAVEAPITPLTLTGFLKMGALAKTGCYPFDEQREGLVLGEGGAVMVLEGLDSAKARKALIYAEIGGYGLTCDAYQISAPNPDSHRGMLAVKKALAQSSLSVTDINHIL